METRELYQKTFNDISLKTNLNEENQNWNTFRFSNCDNWTAYNHRLHPFRYIKKCKSYLSLFSMICLLIGVIASIKYDKKNEEID